MFKQEFFKFVFPLSTSAFLSAILVHILICKFRANVASSTADYQKKRTDWTETGNTT